MDPSKHILSVATYTLAAELQKRMVAVTKGAKIYKDPTAKLRYIVEVHKNNEALLEKLAKEVVRARYSQRARDDERHHQKARIVETAVACYLARQDVAGAADEALVEPHSVERMRKLDDANERSEAREIEHWQAVAAYIDIGGSR